MTNSKPKYVRLDDVLRIIDEKQKWWDEENWTINEIAEAIESLPPTETLEDVLVELPYRTELSRMQDDSGDWYVKICVSESEDEWILTYKESWKTLLEAALKLREKLSK